MSSAVDTIVLLANIELCTETTLHSRLKRKLVDPILDRTGWGFVLRNRKDEAACKS